MGSIYPLSPTIENNPWRMRPQVISTLNLLELPVESASAATGRDAFGVADFFL